MQSSLFVYLFVETESHSVAQTGMQWCIFGSLQAQPPRVVGITGVCHYARLIFGFFFSHVGQAGLELLTSGDSPASASQTAGITGVSHHARLLLLFTLKKR